MYHRRRIGLCTVLLGATLSPWPLAPVLAQGFDAEIPMHDKGVSTFYVPGFVEGYGAAEFMVDTGSGYTTINEETLAVLRSGGHAHYVKDLTGVMADGSRTQLPVYRLTSITIGSDCAVRNVEAAIFPGRARQILGLSALRQVAPFLFSVQPPSLYLSNCSSQDADEAPAKTAAVAARQGS